jgi:hypothetical protein
LIFPAEEFRVRHRSSCVAISNVSHHHQAFLIRIRKWFKEDRIHYAENCGVSPDSDSQNENGSDAKSRIAKQHAYAITKVCKKTFDSRPLPDLAAFLFNQSQVPKFPSRSGHCLFSGHTTLHQLFDFFFEVRLDFVGEISVETAS